MESYPYTGVVGHCDRSRTKSEVLVESYSWIKNQTESVIIDNLNKGPVIASIDASQPIFINYSGGILNSYSCKRHDNNHWVVIVGYGTDHFIIRNSWGKGWGL